LCECNSARIPGSERATARLDFRHDFGRRTGLAAAFEPEHATQDTQQTVGRVDVLIEQPFFIRQRP